MKLILSSICDKNIQDIKGKLNDFGGNLEYEIKCIRNELNLDSQKKQILLAKKNSNEQISKLFNKLKNIPLGYNSQNIFYGSFFSFNNIASHYFVFEYYYGYIYIFQSFQNHYSLIKYAEKQKYFSLQEFRKMINQINNDKNDEEKKNALSQLLCLSKMTDDEKVECNTIVNLYKGHIFFEFFKLDHNNCNIKTHYKMPIA